MKVSLGLDDDPQLGDERGGRPSGGFNHRLLCDQLSEFSAFRAITQIAENSPVFHGKPNHPILITTIFNLITLLPWLQPILARISGDIGIRDGHAPIFSNAHQCACPYIGNICAYIYARIISRICMAIGNNWYELS